jgi:MAF protein
MMQNTPNVILASGSPRRQELFSLLDCTFKVVPAEVDESPMPGEKPLDYVLRLAVEKAQWVHSNQLGSAIILAADTTVVDQGEIMGKPVDEDEAQKMLHRLRGRTHQVFSGIGLIYNGDLITDVCKTDVPMRNYSDEEIRAYIASGDPIDKAGAYAIQHSGFQPVEHLYGCFANVMGLPLCHLTRSLHRLDLPLTIDVPKACQKHTGYNCPIYDTILSLRKDGNSD